ncbi:site-specific tyrosine recombinase XerD [Prauserella halophila]|uniref:Site-specific tyrosine recombinase XerD n=1 Tax=Prauserella halophila TaxID=185641 RepID=A0ABP4GFF4_9PSEU|nr:tyrosine-type recombinase/integrase [Prauserella halophila]MCP2234611.1 Site-specific recombinase XerD [Prauserella halophila]
MDHLNDWLDEWLLELAAGRPGNETIRVYRRSVDQFLTWLRTAYPAVTMPADLTHAHVRDWFAHLVDKGMADSTRRVRGIAVRKWLGYVAAEPDSGLEHNPAARLELPMPQPEPVPVISDDDLSTLLRSMSGGTFVDRRDTAIVRVLLDCGLRRAELVGINVEHLDVRHQTVTVTGKGSKVRAVPFGGRTALALRKYMRARAQRPQANGSALFLSTRADRPGARVTGGGVAEMLSRRAEAAGLTHLHPHQFRHTWAADLKGANMSDDQLERLAGWTTPTMSRRYGSHVADEQAREAARRLARGDRL